MILIADSGSTKTTWCCIDNIPDRQPDLQYVTAAGINPVRDDQATIQASITAATEALTIASKSFNTQKVSHIYFYGAGCIPPYSTTVKRQLQQHFPKAKVQVESDMLGAALALCGHGEGIACILGTGSNSCLFDGEHIVKQTPALGFILGDEGSGASLGKRLVGDILKRQLPEHIVKAFADEMELSQTDIITRVYRQPQPNMFLASLTPFLARHIEDKSVQQLVVDEFRRFLQRNIKAYGRPELPIHFVGGITATFQPQLKQAIEDEGMLMGQILSRPITGMVAYHQAKS